MYLTLYFILGSWLFALALAVHDNPDYYSWRRLPAYLFISFIAALTWPVFLYIAFAQYGDGGTGR